MKCPHCDQEIGTDMLIDLVRRRNHPKVARRTPPDIWALYCPLCGVVLDFVAGK